MAYVSLRKLYYGEKQIYQDIYAARYNCESTIHLDFEISDHPAFFCQSSEVIATMYDILRLNEKISFYSRTLPGAAIKQYQNQCLISEIVTSNKIEGVHSTRKEIGDVLQILESQSSKKGKKKRFTAIVSKYYKLQNGEHISLVNCQDVRSLYNDLLLDEVLQEDSGNQPDGEIFRKEMTEIQSATGKVVHRGAYPESVIIEKMSQALTFLQNSSVEILYRVCVFHYLIEFIHPFYDGNGRLGRFILSDYLSQNLHPLVAYRISETILVNRGEYYDAFMTCNDPRNKGDLTPFLVMMLTMIQRSMLDLEDSLEQKWKQLQRYESMIAALPHGASEDMANLYFILIQASLFTDNGIPYDGISQITGFGKEKVRKLIQNIPEGILMAHTSKNKKFFKLNTDLLDETYMNR